MKKLEYILLIVGLVLIAIAHITFKSLPKLSVALFILSVICCLSELLVEFLWKNVINPKKERDGDTYDP